MNNYLHFYMGCKTNLGRLVGVSKRSAWTENETGEIVEHELGSAAIQVKPLLRRLNALSDTESRELIDKGFSIGRPRGYSFSPEAFIYLLSLSVDLFGLIDSGQAIEWRRDDQDLPPSP